MPLPLLLQLLLLTFFSGEIVILMLLILFILLMLLFLNIVFWVSSFSFYLSLSLLLKSIGFNLLFILYATFKHLSKLRPLLLKISLVFCGIIFFLLYKVDKLFKLLLFVLILVLLLTSFF